MKDPPPGQAGAYSQVKPLDPPARRARGDATGSGVGKGSAGSKGARAQSDVQLLAPELCRVSTRRMVDVPFQSVEAAVDKAIVSCTEGALCGSAAWVHTQLVLFLVITKTVRTRQAELMLRSGRNTAEMDRSSWGVALLALSFMALSIIPSQDDRTDDSGAASAWYTASHISLLCMLVLVMAVFWHRLAVKERLLYTLKCGVPAIICGYVLLYWGVNLAFPSAGSEVIDRVSPTTYMMFGIIILTLDACDCSRRFHIMAFTFSLVGNAYAAIMSSFFWPDMVIHNGTETGTGWAGQFTKNGVAKVSLYGIVSLMAPALMQAWLDKGHASCYLITDFMHKADLIPIDEQQRQQVGPALHTVEEAVAAALVSCEITNYEQQGRIRERKARSDQRGVHKKFVLLTEILKMVRSKQAAVISRPHSALDWSSLGLLAIGVTQMALISIPGGVKTTDSGVATGWYVVCMSVSLVALLALLGIFWRRFLVRERMIATVKFMPTWIIMFYALLRWCALLAYPDPGREITDRLGATFFLILCALIITLDSCDCSRHFHLACFSFAWVTMIYAGVMASFFYNDVIIINGTDTDTGVVGRFTRNGMSQIAFFGMVSMLAPAIMAAWSDTEHTRCYIITSFMYKADLVAEEAEPTDKAGLVAAEAEPTETSASEQ